jgi:hypothetical protein
MSLTIFNATNNTTKTQTKQLTDKEFNYLAHNLIHQSQANNNTENLSNNIQIINTYKKAIVQYNSIIAMLNLVFYYKNYDKMNKYALMAIEAGSNNAILILWHYYQKIQDLITNFYLDMQNIKNEKCKIIRTDYYNIFCIFE